MATSVANEFSIEMTEAPAEDAYAEYIKRKREDSQVEKIGTLRLTTAELASIGNLVVTAVETQSEVKELPEDDLRFWGSIVRSINAAIRDAA